MKNTVFTIYKRELGIYFRSLSGWLFIALNAATLGICAVWLCLRNSNPSYQYVPETASIILCFTIPLLLAMTVGAEWRRGETALILRYASPISVTVGKYLAALTLFAIPVLICAILPLLLIPFGLGTLTVSYIGTLTYATVGAALIAINFFTASLIKQPVIGGIACAAVSLLLNVASNIAKVVGIGQPAPFVIAALILIAAVAAIMLVYLNNTVISVVFAIASSAVVLVLTLTESAPTVLRPVLSMLSPQYAFYENIYGTTSLRGILQPVIISVVFTAFTALAHANSNKQLTLKFKTEEKEDAPESANEN